MAINSGQFSEVQIDNAAGTLVDLSTYFTEFTLEASNEDRDITTFATGGGYVTEKHIRGALSSKITGKLLYDGTPAKHLRQIVASLAGFRVRATSGSNAAPVQGDEIYQGTYTTMGYSLDYKTGSNAMLDIAFDPSDGSGSPLFSTL